ncbi:S41 family peptidase [Dokdonia sp.]|uniref:S41 family peptidase n=1 Tax=Dokdonia sp. TaxID=2024995 RepID=UPI0032638963
MKSYCKKNQLRISMFVILLLCLFSKEMQAQQNNDIQPVTEQEVNTIVDSITSIVKRYYIDPEIGTKIVNNIRTKHKNGAYTTMTNPQTLADTLEVDLRAINNDLHMSMIYRSPRERTTGDAPSIQVNSSGIWSNYGLSEIKVLEGNIGYLKIKHFTRHQYFEAIKPVVTSAIESLKNTEALIVDVRDNGGGFEDMVAYYISYFFDSKEPIHLSDYRCTLHGHTYGISTDPNVLGTKLPDTKLYVLVNANTGSAAESFAYMLKHLGRATIIGETTVGAGNGASIHSVNDRFIVQVSSEETINAVTKTSFEQVGVIPHIKTTSAHAFTKGYQLAITYAKENNTSNIDPSNYENLLEFISIPDSNANIDTSAYTKYLGTYQGGAITITITLENNILYGQVRSNGGKMALTPLEDHIFKVGDIKERIQFVLDTKGEVTQLIGIDSPMELTKVVD